MNPGDARMAEFILQDFCTAGNSDKVLALRPLVARQGSSMRRADLRGRDAGALLAYNKSVGVES